MKLIYKTLNILSIFFMVLGVAAGFAIKLGVADIPQLNEISSIIAIEYSAMIFISGGIFFILNELLHMLEEYLKGKDKYNTKH